MKLNEAEMRMAYQIESTDPNAVLNEIYMTWRLSRNQATDSTFNFVAALMYSQLFNLLCDKADGFYGGRLPVHVRLILDEFANIGQIPNFDKLIATIRSREISASIILQSQSQLKTIYKDAADTIVGNCDSTLFLGGKEKSTLKETSELLGKETIDSYKDTAHWEHYGFRGTKWYRRKQPELQRYLVNSYRVLLTRARQGMILFVPKGVDPDVDSTRDCAFYDGIFHYLKECGIPELNG